MKAFCSWSGGKDCALAYYQAEQKGIKVKYLLNMVNSRASISRSHRLSPEILRAQAEALKAKLIQPKAAWSNYETRFKSALKQIKKDGVLTGVFGDIDLQVHRDWVERVCRESQIKPVLPLWLKKREALMNKLIDSGFKAIVVALRRDLMGTEWLGRKIDKQFVCDLKNKKNIDLCGEGGEYHSFVYDGPIFKNKVKYKTLGKYIQGKHAFLKIGV